METDADLLKRGATPRGVLIRNALRAAIECIEDLEWDEDRLLEELRMALTAAADL